MRRFIEFAINKSALNHTLLLLIVILSYFAYKNVPKEIFPPVVLDKILITGSYAGASAQTLDKMVVQNIEDELKNVQGLGDIDAIVKNGRFTIVSDIKEGENNLIVLNDVKDKIAKIKKDLPPDMDEPVATVMKKSFPLVLIAIATSQNDQHKLLDVANDLKDRLSSIKDLSDIDIRGWREDELKIAIDKDAIDALGISFSLLASQIQNLSTIFPIGAIKQRGNHFFLTTENGKKKVEELRNTIIEVGGKRVLLGQIAQIKFGLSDPAMLSHFNGKPNLSINITKTQNGNAIELVRKIKRVLEEFNKKYPSFELKVYTDTSVWIRNRLNTVTSNLFFGLILVTLALLLSVNWRIALVVAMGIPVSFMIGLIALEMLGYSLNMLSLFGALIALGMLVDEAIVVAENIYRHLENGDDPKTAAINGALEMFPAVLTATATTIFAFLPLIILSGEMGKFIRILPIIISILLLSSLFEAFYFLPLHAKDILKVSKEKRSRLWERLGKQYTKLLRVLLRHNILWLMLIIISILFATGMLMKKAKFQLFPSFDTTQIYITGRVSVNNDIKDTEKIVAAVEKEIIHHINKDEVKSVTTIVGMKLDAKNNAQLGDNLFHIFINLHELKPQNFVDRYITPLFSVEYDDSDMKRDRSASAIAKDLKKIVQKFQHEPFEEINVIVPQAGIVKSDVEISLVYEKDSQVLQAIKILEDAMQKIDGVYNITDDAKEGEKELKLVLNDYGQKLGITEGYLASYLRSLYLDAEVAKMFRNNKLIYIKLKRLGKDSIDKLQDLRIDVPNTNQKVLLTSIVKFVKIDHFYDIIKENGEKIRTVYASLDKHKITSAEFYDKIAPVLEKIKKLGVGIKIKGEQKENEKLMREITRAFIIAIFLIFAALLLMFNSVIHTLIVLSVIPLSLLGVLIGNQIMGLNLTMPGLLGLVGLAGVVVNDGLIMLDFIRECKDSECVIRRASLRLRPIILTSVTTVLGLSTLIFFASGQSLILQPMAVTLGYGIAWATVINLLIVPLMFYTITFSKPKFAILNLFKRRGNVF
ncbi:efflux RND transporter permease subunit [Nitratiruptor sp. YY09-18]|uniref:efflux RND transporter permease subunit n=1 Tax=Nitratiruptor sp. YY09-18 TaxID=2724901 RepID=UPI0019169BF4|nr:efflux RND transporter permease subunit [Nitratiruptor sp. YY09-18]BCD68229.1 hypothetical protein NitYY0918_C1140 [Nitratiruptor sp. YY09-18]